ncbi:hypothetical protein BGX38DRAFT_1146797 [Terfezia claveryi]|nr:hypothetical protein BGX38DRAFT_1146797 [Terfezia claveryi]
MSNPDHFSTIILLSLLIPGGLLGLLMILWWFRILDRPRVLRIIRSNQEYPSTSTSTSGKIHSRTTIPETRQGRAKRWSFTRGGFSHGDLESGMSVGGGGEGGRFTGGGLRRKGGEETSGRVPVAVAGGRGKGYGWEEKGESENTSLSGSIGNSFAGEDQQGALAASVEKETGGRKERKKKQKRASITSAILASKKKKQRKERGTKGIGTGTETGGRARGSSKRSKRHQMGILGPSIDEDISKRISTKAVVGTAGTRVDRSNSGRRNAARCSGLQALNPQDLQNLSSFERRYSRDPKRGSVGIGNPGSGGYGLRMAAMIDSIRNSGSTGITGGTTSMRNSGMSGVMNAGGDLGDSINSVGRGDMGMGMINPESVRNSGGSGGVRNSILELADDPDRYGPWYVRPTFGAGEPAAPGQGGPQEFIPTIPVPMPDAPRPGDSNRTSSNIAAALAAGGSSNRSSNSAAALAIVSNQTSSKIGVPLNSPGAGCQKSPLPPPSHTFPSMLPNPIDPAAQRYSGAPLPPPAIPAAAAGRGRGDSIIRDSALSRDFLFPTAETPPPPPHIATPIPLPPAAVPQATATPPAAASARSDYGDDFKGFGKFPVPEKAKLRERDSEGSSVD